MTWLDQTPSLVWWISAMNLTVTSFNLNTDRTSLLSTISHYFYKNIVCSEHDRSVNFKHWEEIRSKMPLNWSTELMASKHCLWFITYKCILISKHIWEQKRKQGLWQVSTGQRAGWRCAFVSVWTCTQSLCRCKAEKCSANQGCRSPKRCRGLLHPTAVPSQLATAWATCFTPDKVCVFGFVLLLSYFLDQKVSKRYPNFIFPSFSAWQNFLILCVIMKHHKMVVTLPRKTGNPEWPMLFNISVLINFGWGGSRIENIFCFCGTLNFFSWDLPVVLDENPPESCALVQTSHIKQSSSFWNALKGGERTSEDKHSLCPLKWSLAPENAVMNLLQQTGTAGSDK